MNTGVLYRSEVPWIDSPNFNEVVVSFEYAYIAIVGTAIVVRSCSRLIRPRGMPLSLKDANNSALNLAMSNA